MFSDPGHDLGSDPEDTLSLLPPWASSYLELLTPLNNLSTYHNYEGVLANLGSLHFGAQDLKS
jgi:hypothetical protein